MSGRRLFACRLLPLLPLLGGEQSQAEKVQVYSSGATSSMLVDDESTDVVPEETLAELEEGQDACADCRGGTAATGQQATNITDHETSLAGQGGAVLASAPAVPSTQHLSSVPNTSTKSSTYEQHQELEQHPTRPAPAPTKSTAQHQHQEEEQEQDSQTRTRSRSRTRTRAAGRARHQEQQDDTQHQSGKSSEAKKKRKRGEAEDETDEQEKAEEDGVEDGGRVELEEEDDVVAESAARFRRELRREILAPGCYLKQVTGSQRCPASKKWVQDTWGRTHVHSHTSKANCKGRKTGHDNWCRITGGSSWLFVPSKEKAQLPPPTQHGCYYKDEHPAHKELCAEIKDWTIDKWGKKHAKSDESKESCEGRKQGHDTYCGSKVSQWLYVPRPPAAGQRNSVLCIGNSLTYTIFHVLQDAFTQGRTGLSFQRITTGGRKMDTHKNSLQQGDVHYRNTLSAKKWKYVVLQEAGYMPWRHSYNSKTFKKSLKAVLWWDKKIQELGAETVLYEPPARRDGTRNMRSAKGRKLNFKAYHRATKEGVDQYVKALKKKGRKPKFAPVGTAFLLTHMKDKRLWHGLYDRDGTHPSHRGQYLASCVLFATISGDSPKSLHLPKVASSYRHYADWEKNVLKPAAITAEDGATLREIAHKAVFG